MAAAKKEIRKTGARRKSVGRKAGSNARGGSGTLTRIEQDLPPTLRDFSRKVRRQLTVLERKIERAEARYRREGARVLRHASHRLGHFEAKGERAWKRTTTQARREALGVLRRLERAIEGPKPRRKTARPGPRKVASGTQRPRAEVGGSGI